MGKGLRKNLGWLSQVLGGQPKTPARPPPEPRKQTERVKKALQGFSEFSVSPEDGQQGIEPPPTPPRRKR